MQKSYTVSSLIKLSDVRVAIVQARWHAEHTDRMVVACEEILKGSGCVVENFQVPGSYELPLATKKLAQSKRYAAIVVIGAVIKGDTDHYEVIVETCTRELGRVMYELEVPVIMELLPVHSLEQLIARTTGEHNKGIEAAQATLQIIEFYRSLSSRFSQL